MSRNKKEGVGFGTASVVSSRPLVRPDEGRASEDDMILYTNLKLLEFEESLFQWPEFASVKINLTQNMFSAPNRATTEAIVYFLLSSLTSRDSVKRDFRDVWPPKNANQTREFRSRVVEKIKESAMEWGISTDSVQVLAGLLQRNSGQKLVRLLCELSYAVMKRSIPVNEIGDSEIGVSEIADRLVEARIRVGKAKIVKLQQQFLQLVVDGQSYQEEVLNSATKIIDKHADLSREMEGLKIEMQTLAPDSAVNSQSCTNEQIEKFVPSWKTIASLFDNFEELGCLVETMTKTVSHPCAISGEKLLVLQSKSFNEKSTELVPRTDEERSTFESELAFPTLGLREKTQVDVLSMLEFWVHCGVGELVSLLESLVKKNVETNVVKELMYNKSIPDIICQTRDAHKRHLEEMKALKAELLEDIAKLDDSLESEEATTSVVSEDQSHQAPTLMSLLRK